MIEGLRQLLKENQFLVAGLGLSGAGLITFWVRDLPLKIFDFIKRQITTDLMIHNYDVTFYEILKWIKENHKHKNFRTLKVNNGKWGNDENSTVSLGYGRHIIKYKNNYIMLNYSKASSDSISERNKETITITKLGRSKKLFEDFLHDIEEKSKDVTKLKVYKMSSDDWYFCNYIRKRPLETIFLEKEKKDKIFTNIKKFKEKEEWYIDNGIPYQYGILLYGEPGTGKTSLIKAIASELNYNIYYLTPSKLGSIETALSSCDENSIVVIEDIDSNTSVHSRQDEENKDSNLIGDFLKTSLSDILNSIDGINNVHGRLLICTTNHIEKLDKALIRPGRFDLLVKINHINTEIISQFFNFYFPENKIDFENIKIKDGISVAELQNMVLLEKSSDEILKEVVQ